MIKLIDSKTPFPEIVNQLKDNGITIKNIYKFNSQRSEIIKCFESSISTKVKSLKKCFLPIRLNDAIIAITQIRKYITQCNGSANCFELINKLENEIYVNKSNVLKQSKITDFMSISWIIPNKNQIKNFN